LGLRPGTGFVSGQNDRHTATLPPEGLAAAETLGDGADSPAHTGPAGICHVGGTPAWDLGSPHLPNLDADRLLVLERENSRRRLLPKRRVR
jgi:hypothetical protein